MTSNEIIKKLESLKNPKNIEGMGRFACGGAKTLGISMPVLRKIAKEINKDYRSSSARTKNLNSSQITSNSNRDSSQIQYNVQNDRHQLAHELWDSGYHEARILASMIDDASLVTNKQIDSWIADFDSWDICDQVCMNLFSRSPLAYDKAIEWATRKKPARRSIPNETRMNNSMCSIENEGREFEKRAGFALMAVLAWQEKNNDLSDEKYKQFFPIIIREATDDRNFVKKAVNWALRQIGKSRPSLRQPAIDCAKEILKVYSEQSRGAKWIANDAIRELTNLKK